MKYIMIDTNIFIDMIVDRQHNVNSKLIESFIKLLDFNEIKLVIPEIVIYETNKHYKEQICEVRKKINCAIEAIDKIYGMNIYTIEGLEVYKYKNKSKKELKKLLDIYDTNEEDYVSEVNSLMTNIFEHKNCIIIFDTDKLRSLSLKRRIYKRAPLQHEKKESYADGLIVETLLHIKDYIDLDDNDSVLLVSGNTSDFSDYHDKAVLHKDIVEDLKIDNLYDKIKYITRFNELIGKELKEEVENANLQEEFEKETEEREEIRRAEHDTYIIDTERASVGLSSLGYFEEELYNDFTESGFAINMNQLFERIESCYFILEEIYSFYYDELESSVLNTDSKNVTRLIEEWNNIFSKLGFTKVTEDINGLIDILSWIKEKCDETDYSAFRIELPDKLNYSDDVQFYSKERKRYKLNMDIPYLCCKNGEIDYVKMKLTSGRDINIIGEIEIVYGYVEYDEDGGVGDACSEEISYKTDEIVEYVESLTNELEKFVEDEQKIVKLLGESFNI